MTDTEFMERGYDHIRPKSYDSLTGMPYRPWRPMKDIEVVEDVLNDLRSNDRERELALRLLNLIEGAPPRAEKTPRRQRD